MILIKDTDPPKDPPFYRYNDPRNAVATRQDSLDAYNAMVNLLGALEREGYHGAGSVDPEVHADFVPFGHDNVGLSIQDHHRRARGDYSDYEKGLYLESTEGITDPPTLDEFWNIVDNETDGPVTRVREMTTGVVNPNLPLSYYHTGIQPQGLGSYIKRTRDRTDEYEGDFVEVPYYDPIAVKPYDLLTDEEKAERLEKYGPEPFQQAAPAPIPASQRGPDPDIEIRPDTENAVTLDDGTLTPMKMVKKQTVMVPQPAPAPRPLTPIRPSATIDHRLRPMTPIKTQTGRQPELIMRANPRMKTGEEPNYYKVWDDKRKQWTTRPVEPEELDRYRRQNRIGG